MARLPANRAAPLTAGGYVSAPIRIVRGEPGKFTVLYLSVVRDDSTGPCIGPPWRSPCAAAMRCAPGIDWGFTPIFGGSVARGVPHGPRACLGSAP
ncbi:hypothetical protein GCM10010102_23810 [Promicromonospora citrea]|uniref:Uncharacterized protein n=1 Tax=Promicromonospora citrea TaxID=43677 RepID=A0A8H9L3A1_9MICO|nr:hypothetical protein GCM10010102_23810 [Promicromonospora citrea]